MSVRRALDDVDVGLHTISTCTCSGRALDAKLGMTFIFTPSLGIQRDHLGMQCVCVSCQDTVASVWKLCSADLMSWWSLWNPSRRIYVILSLIHI